MRKKTLIFVSIILILNGSASAIIFQHKQDPPTECDFRKYKPVRISEKTPVIKRITPQYPPLAKTARVKGTVQVIVLVNRKGDVVGVCTIDGHPLLKAAARKAAWPWK